MRALKGNTSRPCCRDSVLQPLGRMPKLFLLRLILVLVSLLVLTWPNILQAGVNEWTPMGPDAASIRSFAINPVHPSTLYAGTWQNGVFKSTNGGESWTATGLSVDAYSLAVDSTQPDTLYAGSALVYRSTNGGASWTDSTGPNCFVNSLAINPDQSSILYAGTNGGVFKSINGGDSWTAANTGIPDHEGVSALAMDPVQPTTLLYAGTWFGVFKSTNGGESWTAAGTGLPSTPDIRVLVIDPTQPTTLYAGTWGNGVFKSTNGGGSWSAMNTGLSHTQLYALAIDPTGTNLYAGTSEGGAFSYQPSAVLTPMLDLLLLQ